MPGIDGWEVCRQLKETPEVRHIPVIFLSARAQDEDRQRGYALGVDEYVTKPFDPAHLVEIVRRSLSKRSTQARRSSRRDDRGTALRTGPRGARLGGLRARP